MRDENMTAMTVRMDALMAQFQTTDGVEPTHEPSPSVNKGPSASVKTGGNGICESSAWDGLRADSISACPATSKPWGHVDSLQRNITKSDRSSTPIPDIYLRRYGYNY